MCACVAEGQQLRYCGIGAGFDDTIVDGNLDELKFVVYYVKQGKVVAVARYVFLIMQPSSVGMDSD